MAHVRVSRTSSDDLQTVWSRIGDFEDPGWLPGVTLERMDGATRVLSVPPSQTIRETLVSQEDYAMTWQTAETPLPIEQATVTLSARAVDDGTEVTWDMTFTPTEQVQAQAEAMMRDMVADMLRAVAD